MIGTIIGIGITCVALKILYIFGNRIIEWYSSSFSRAKNINSSSLTVSNTNLGNRNISNIVENPKIVKLVRDLVIGLIERINIVLCVHNKDLAITYNNDGLISDLLINCAKGYRIVIGSGYEEDLIEVIKSNPRGIDKNDEDVSNANICFNTAILIFLELIRQKCKSIDAIGQLTQKQNNTITNNITSVLEEAIMQLEEIQEDFYWELFRVMLDTNHNCTFKGKAILRFFGITRFSDAIFVKHSDLAFTIIHQIIRIMPGFGSLQFLLDYLYEMKHMPGNIQNLEKGKQISVDCKKCFAEILSYNSAIMEEANVSNGNPNISGKSTCKRKTHAKNSSPITKNLVNEKLNIGNGIPSQFYICNKRVNTALENLESKFTKFISQARLKERKMNQELRQGSNGKGKEEWTKPDNYENNFLTLQSESREKVTARQLRHENSLMEGLRTIKAELKTWKKSRPKCELVPMESHAIRKSNNSSHVFNRREITDEDIEKMISKYKSDHQLLAEHEVTLRMVSKENPPMQTIKHKHVIKLVNRAGGQVTGITGSKLRISWGGGYEAQHDEPRFLTPKFAKKVGKSFWVHYQHILEAETKEKSKK